MVPSEDVAVGVREAGPRAAHPEPERGWGGRGRAETGAELGRASRLHLAVAELRRRKGA